MIDHNLIFLWAADCTFIRAPIKLRRSLFQHLSHIILTLSIAPSGIRALEPNLFEGDAEEKVPAGIRTLDPRFQNPTSCNTEQV